MIQIIARVIDIFMPRKLISLVTALLFLLQSTLALALPYRYADTRVFSYCDCEFERNLVAGVFVAAGRNLELSSLQTRRMDKGVERRLEQASEVGASIQAAVT